MPLNPLNPLRRADDRPGEMDESSMSHNTPGDTPDNTPDGTDLEPENDALAADADRIMLHLSDHPAVATATVRRLLDEAEGADYVHPRRHDRGGHPVVLSRAIAARILDAPLPDGLRSARTLPGFRIHAVDLDDAGVQLDLDTPEDWPGGDPPA